MGELTPKRRFARLLLGVTLMSAGLLVAWKIHDTGLGLFWSRLITGLGGMVAMYGLMCLLESGAIATLMVLGGAGFLSWSLWAVLSGGGDADIAKFGLWGGPLVAIVGLLFVSPHWRSEVSDKSK